jgi:hypothetical protein
MAISNTKAFAIVLAAALCMPDMADAATFPAPLLGKSVIVSWTANRQQKFEGTDEVVSRSVSASLRVYISTAGRTFIKESVSGGGGMGRDRDGRGGGRGRGTSFEGEQAPGDPASSMGRNDVVHMEGGALMVDRKMIEGARRISITFDAGYGSCTARVIVGREGGTGALRGRNPVNGRRFEIISVDIATPSCSIASGNVFGGE